MNTDKRNKIKEMLDAAAGIPDGAERSRKYKSIVEILSQEAVRSNDFLHIDEALKIADLVTDDPSKAYLSIIRAITRLNRKDINSFDKAVKITEKIDNFLDLSVALHEIVVAFGKFGIDKKDELIYSKSLDIIQKIPLDTFRSMACRNLSKSMAGTDQIKSLELVNKSIEILENSKGIEPLYLISAFCDTGAVLAGLNDTRSHIFFKKAIAMADYIKDDFEKSAVLLKIVETGIEMGTQLKDENLVNEASVISKGITREYYRTLASNTLKNLVGKNENK